MRPAPGMKTRVRAAACVSQTATTGDGTQGSLYLDDKPPRDQTGSGACQPVMKDGGDHVVKSRRGRVQDQARRTIVSMRYLRTGRLPAVMAVIAAVELASAAFTIGVAAAAPGLTTVVTVSIDGATGSWAPARSTAAVPRATVPTDAATTPPVPTSDQSVVSTTLAAPETTSTSTAPVEESSSPNASQPKTRS
ncbi:MAG: hypothetical protein QOI56_2138 [Actinomycetota bacterium]|nr:hypothetical protein [Actinomycetota bacterium]